MAPRMMDTAPGREDLPTDAGGDGPGGPHSTSTAVPSPHIRHLAQLQYRVPNDGGGEGGSVSFRSRSRWEIPDSSKDTRGYALAIAGFREYSDPDPPKPGSALGDVSWVRIRCIHGDMHYPLVTLEFFFIFLWLLLVSASY